MGFLQNIFGKKEQAITSYADFWNWFLKNERVFFKAVKEGRAVEEIFSSNFFPKLTEVNDGFFYLVGMFNNDTVELKLTVEGNIKNIVFIEDFVDAAPKIDGWMFTKLKPAISVENVDINMNGYKFNRNNISFYENEDPAFPDEIDITIVYDEYEEENKCTIMNGVYIFLDNFLGELNFATTIDNLEIVGKNAATGELVPIDKLTDFLVWRQKEFVEKYDGVRHDTENDAYSAFEAKLDNGNPLIAIINTELLNWDSKASHPWVMNVEIKYGSEKSNNGMPDQKWMTLLSEIEDEALKELKDVDGYLNIGRQTANGIREIYFACKDFRKPSKVIQALSVRYSGKVSLTYNIYKDKYWQSFDRFNQ